MRNWNFRVSTKQTTVSPLRAYLWGIETGQKSRARNRCSKLRAYLWGIETECGVHLAETENEIASLPMRNWNNHYTIYKETQQSIASLPMRNWNWVQCEKLKGVQKNCEPTYEELKLRVPLVIGKSAVVLRAYLWGIETVSERKQRHLKNTNCEPTYEELKHVFKELFRWVWRLLRAYLWGIETSIFEVVYFAFGVIASLPMRNWNAIENSNRLTWVEQLRAYLWGIETTLSLKSALQHHTLRAYLWGIETKIC